MTIKTIEKNVKELKQLQEEAEKLNKKITAIQDKLKAELLERETAELETDLFKIRYTDVITNRFDTTAFKKCYSDLYSQFIKQCTTKRFTVA